MRCSNRCANPVRPGDSFFEPTWYQRLTATIGTEWSSWISTSSPLASVCLVYGRFIATSWLPADDGAFAPEIRAAAQLPRRRIHPGGDNAGGDAEGRPDEEHMAARLQLAEDRSRQAGLHLEDAGLSAVVVERAHRVEGIDARRFDGALHVHAEIDDVEQHEEDLLILTVAAGRADGEERLAVLEDHRRRQRGPRALP